MEANRSSRSFLLLAVGVVLAIEAAIFGYRSLHGADVGPGIGWLRVGSTEQVDAAGVTFVEQIPAYVVTTAEGRIGLYAKSPQLGEPVEYCASSGFFEDRMHGSMFDSLGNYVLGPAPHGLDHLPVRTVGGDVWIDPSDPIIGAPRGSHTVDQAGPMCLAAGSR